TIENTLHLTGALGSLVRLEGQATMNEFAEGQRRFRAVLLDWLQHPLPGLGIERDAALASGQRAWRMAPSDHPIHGGPQVVDIGALADDAIAGLFGGHVLRRTLDAGGLR